MNAMDFLPVDIMAFIYKHAFGLENWRQVPTADVNTTFALALTVWLLMISPSASQSVQSTRKSSTASGSIANVLLMQ